MAAKSTISKATLRGYIIFSVLLIMLFIVPDLIVYFRPADRVHISQSDASSRKSFRKVQRYQLSYSRKPSFDRKRYRRPPGAFDPNTYTLEDWMYLGLSEKQAAVVLKFSRHGIHSQHDLQSIFVIPEELFDLIKDSVRYPERVFPEREPKTRTIQEVRHLNLNAALAEELVTVPGLGTYFAGKIVEYREQLGGFHKLDQLSEIWQMDEERLDRIRPYLFLTEGAVRRININTAGVDQLKAHPYISWNLANSIVKLRTQTGGYKRLEDVRKSVLMTDELYEKLKYYLTIEE